jgi:AcrR family transcriptional regulator
VEAETPTTPRPGPRERLLEAATALTYTDGVHVGVDAILRQADVARRSLYQHFGGKDGLVAQTLRASADAARLRGRAVMDAAGDIPRDRVLAYFEELEATTSQPTFQGCRFTAAELALAAAHDHPAHAEIRAHKDGLHAMFAGELLAAGHPDPVFGADQLLVLVEGVLAHAVTQPDARSARAARAMVEFVLDAGSDAGSSDAAGSRSGGPRP